MAKQVTSNEIYQDNIFAKLKNETQEQIDKFDALDKKLGDVSASLKLMLKNLKFDNSKDFEKLAKALKDSEAMAKQVVKAEQEISKLKALNSKATEAEAKATIATMKAKEAQAKATARQTRETEKLNSAYKQESARLNELRNRYKDLAVQNKTNTKEARAMLQEITKLDAKLKSVDATVGQNQRSVGNYSKAIGGLRNGLMQLGVSFGVFQVLRSGITTISDFQSSLAELSAITGVSGAELDQLGDKSIDLSKKYGTSASNINEALKLAGSARPELLKNSEALAEFTEKALILSKASGDDVQTSISNLASTLNAFEEPATKAGKTMDILANASQLGTQEIPYLTDAFTKFGGIAKANNVSIAESASLVEELGKKFPEATMAGTGLRNVMLKMSATRALPPEALNALNKYGISLEGLEDKSKPFSERLQLLKPLLKDNAALVKIFGTENYLAAQTLIQGSERIGEFTKQLDKNGTAQDQANIKSKTLAEAGGRLKANFEALFLEFRNGSGALTTVVDFLARNLGTVVSVLTKLGALYLVFIARQKILNTELVKGFKGVGSFKDGLKGMVSNLKEGASAGTGLGGALKGIGWTALIGLAFEYAQQLYNIANGAKNAAYAQLLLDNAKKKGAKVSGERITQYEEESNALLKQLELKKAQGKIDERQFIEQKKMIKQSEKAKIETAKRFATEGRKRLLKEQKEAIKAFNKAKKSVQGDGLFGSGVGKGLKEGIEGSLLGQDGYNKSYNRLASINALLSERTTEIYVYNQALKRSSDELHSNNIEQIEFEKGITLTPPKLDKYSKEVKKLATELEQLDEYASNYLETQKRLQEQAKQYEIDRLTSDIEKYIQVQKDRIDAEGFFNEDDLRTMLQNKLILLQDQAITETDFQVKEIEKRYQEMYDAELKAIENNRDELLKQEGLTIEQKNKIEQSYDDRVRELNARRVELEKDKSAEIQVVNNDLETKLVEIVKENNAETKQSIQDLFDYRDNRTNESVKNDEDALKKKQELAQAERDLAKMLADYLIEQSNRTIEQLDKQIANAEKNADYLQTLAENGNIKAEQSYSKEQEIIREANLQKQKELQRQQRIKLAETVFSTYNTKLNNPETSENALSETIKDVSILEAFINSLPKYYYGTEDTGKSGIFSDQYGKITGVTHENERVIEADKNKELKGLSNSNIVDIVKLHNSLGSDGFKKVDGFDVAGKSMDLIPIIKELAEVKKAIQNQPTTDYNFDKIVRGVAVLIKEEKRGNVRITTKNRLS